MNLDLPLSGSVPISRHCSALGAIAAQPRACRQARAYLMLLRERGDDGLTDYESAILLGLERSTINARRGSVSQGDEPWVIASGRTRPGPTGIRNTVWVLSPAGARALDAMREGEGENSGETS